MKIKPTIVIISLACAAATGCTTASRTITGDSGIKQSTKVSTFLTTIQGFHDQITPDGTSETSMENYAADTQAIIAIGQILDNLMSKAILLASSGNTNLSPMLKSYLASQAEKPTPKISLWPQK